MIVRSGGTWADPTGAIHDKIHLHWRLSAPAHGADRLKLKSLREFAARVVDGDPSSGPICHPIRWPGSWHRKGAPRLCAIEAINADREINLDAAFDILAAEAKIGSERPNGAGGAANAGADASTSKMPLDKAVDNILAGLDLHVSITSAATGLLGGGLGDGLAVKLLRTIMGASAAERDTTRWRTRYDYIPRAVSSARALIDANPQRETRRDNGQWEPPPNYGAPPIGDPLAPKRIKITMGANMEPQTIAWLWPGWLAHGKLHILAGRPGSLKTTTAMDFAATETVGGQWPDGSPASAGNVLVWSGEDAIDDTLLPRFMAAGGDRTRVSFISGVEEDGKTRSFDPARDMESSSPSAAKSAR